MSIFKRPVEIVVAPRYKLLLARIFGTPVHEEEDWLFKRWRGQVFVFARRGEK